MHTGMQLDLLIDSTCRSDRQTRSQMTTAAKLVCVFTRWERRQRADEQSDLTCSHCQ